MWLILMIYLTSIKKILSLLVKMIIWFGLLTVAISPMIWGQKGLKLVKARVSPTTIIILIHISIYMIIMIYTLKLMINHAFLNHLFGIPIPRILHITLNPNSSYLSFFSNRTCFFLSSVSYFIPLPSVIYLKFL